MFPVGTVINGSYQILALLGEGGMGAVFKAFDRAQSRMVALKFLHQSFSKDQVAVQRFLQEGEILATVRHPCIVEVYSLETDSQTQLPFLIMEFFPGRNLTDLKKEFALDPIRLITVFLELLDGVKAFHGRNIIHRDLKPANILINSLGALKIVDFGIAKGTKKQTRTGTALGTPHYMSPEQCEGKPTITCKSDIYALGVVLWEMLAGTPPFDVSEDSSDPFLGIILKHLTAPVPVENLAATPFGGLFSELLTGMLAKKPQDRPEIEDIMAALEELRASLVGKMDAGIRRFSLEREVQSGPFGKFHLARDLKSEGPVMVQLVPDPLPWPIGRVMDRVTRLARVRHPGLVPVLEKGLDQGSGLHFLTMEATGMAFSRATGESGSEIRSFEAVRDALTHDRDALSKFMLKLLESLSVIHELGEIHGNLNPVMIGFTSDGDPLLTGFPMVPVVAGDPGTAGASAWLAPEQWGAPPGIFPASDIYTAGLIFWELLFGDLPLSPGTGCPGVGDRAERAAGQTLAFKPLSPKDPVFPFFESLCEMIRKNPGDRPSLEDLLKKLRLIRKNMVFPDRVTGPRESLHCLVMTRDETLATLLTVTLKEYGFQYRRGETLEELARMSTATQPIAWFLDLDGIRHSVADITERATGSAPDAKVVFFASRFTRELVDACLDQQATALLVKPLVVPRLVLILNSLSEEPELLEKESLFPFRAQQPEAREAPVEGQPFHILFFECPVCKERFGSMQYKPGAFELRGAETDFCPICTGGVVPELYSVVVCPSCLFADFGGRFQRAELGEAALERFQTSEAQNRRTNLAQDLDFQGEREFREGLKSFELAVQSARDLGLAGLDKHSSEFSLKASWLCRRLGKTLAENYHQTQALECFMRLYQPYLLLNGRFPDWGYVKERLKPGQELLRERAVVVTGFLGAELSARLGLIEQAEFYFEQVFGLPFFTRFTLLARHANRAFQEFRRKHPKGAKRRY